MKVLNEKQLISLIRKDYPDCNTKELANKLGISISKLRKIAAKYGIKKSPEYKKKLHKELMKAKKRKYNENIKNYSLNQIQRNILVGSVLGDGNLSLYGRSKNAHYREHGSNKQIPYRKWKAQMLSQLDFKFSKNGKLYSPSHPIYTNLYNEFYNNKVKTITKENIKLLDHPIGLACLYMDDGSLVLNVSANKKSNKIYITPHVYLYSLNFTMEENIILKNHIKEQFGIEFKLKKRPDGNNYILEIGKRNELMKFINLIKPYVEQIHCMTYKIDIKKRLEDKKQELKKLYHDKMIIEAPLEVIDNTYSKEDELLIIELKKKGITDKEIAKKSYRTYWGIVDKIRRLRQEGKL
ncbi:LAGLIDADG DNA endonuclease family protein [Caloranaerobacter azorensis DSM 13643]|uniref:LAGLIDADG DNA endonuclease family protein n=1 Tax=Caloranaerobacter azorensis DSM 13643 TaxID=1121264 RepID=A0A1M5V3G8_9FIRM|nr:hypothetical protein [Caloranaerobacter azorensis]SHH69765.1 LAGLIDADG DNA endonuclease family protein [Caloranaerobacter azorensis DSM 13643]